MKFIAIICRFKWVGISTSVLNTAYFWESYGFGVDLYLENPDTTSFPLPDFGSRNINVIISNISSHQVQEDLIFRKEYFIKKKYQWVICFDHGALIRGGFSTLFTGSKLIYHSLEFFEPGYIHRDQFKRKILAYFTKFLEILFSFRAKYIFIQDKYRMNFLKRNLLQPVSKFRIIYNSPNEKHIALKSDYFREKFEIPATKLIVLCIGTIVQEHYVWELLDSLESWSEKFVLVIHGVYFEEETLNRINRKKEKFPAKLYVSDKMFDDNQKHIPYTSCDIGFVGFKPLNNNLRFAAGSAGKLFDFMQYGKPIIALNTPGMKEIVDSNQIGRTFDIPGETSDRLSEIADSYKEFSLNASSSFNKYSFSKQYLSVFEEITKTG